MTSRTIRVEALARVEGEGSLHLRYEGEHVAEVRLGIFEPPRFFEALLRGRQASEAPDITARICGICPAAYQMSAVHALEAAAGVHVEGPLRDLRRLLYCGEWIESHALHVYLLHAPDFLGYDDAVAMAKEHGDTVRRGLRLKQAGNRILALLGGREVHPVNVRVGGFHRVPTAEQVRSLRPELEWALEAAVATVRWAAAFDFPPLDGERELVALHHPDEYPMNEGRICSTGGLDFDAAAFETHVEEVQVAHATALHARLRARGAYLTGPLARYALNRARLTPTARELAAEVGLGDVVTNPFRSILVRGIEIVLACEEALRLIRDYQPPEIAALAVAPEGRIGMAATEAPRGLLWHRYDVDDAGRIRSARIVPPTSQNQASIEVDLAALASGCRDLDDDALRRRLEHAIRNHDPCISCATHFLRLDVVRG